MLCHEIEAFNQKDMKKKRLKSFIKRLKRVISEMENENMTIRFTEPLNK